VENSRSRSFLTGNQHHAEARFALHHASVGACSSFERKRLDHRADVLQNTEGKGVLVINRRAGQRVVNRAASKDERERTHLNRSSGTPITMSFPRTPRPATRCRIAGHFGSSGRRRRPCDKGQCDSCGRKILRSPAANIYSNEQERLAGVLKQHRELS
jgi:hypothetical protein